MDVADFFYFFLLGGGGRGVRKGGVGFSFENPRRGVLPGEKKGGGSEGPGGCLWELGGEGLKFLFGTDIPETLR